MTIKEIIEKQRSFFLTSVTKDYEFRIENLKKLKQILLNNKREISNCIYLDLKRTSLESYYADIMPVLSEIDYTIKNLKKWTKKLKVKSFLLTKSFVVSEPYGCVLIVSPWNYPMYLSMAPLVGAIAAGNCVILKMSKSSSYTTKILTKLINNNFNDNYIKVIENSDENKEELLNEKFDYIFYTGSTKTGYLIHQKASKHLIPTTLELGGKSPVIVDCNVNIKMTANRIIWGKTFNNGQTCIAPDYLFVDKRIKNELIIEMIKSIKSFYGDDIQNSKYYSRIINLKQFNRLKSYLDGQNILFGGKTDENDLFIEPTIVDSPDFNSDIMTNEIFGPILAIFAYENIDKVINFINSRPKPLALYVFSKNKKFCENILSKTTSGTSAINDVMAQIMSKELPFGGVGESGMGKYHGKYSFDTFSNKRSVFKNNFLFDRHFFYPPYKFDFLMKR